MRRAGVTCRIRYEVQPVDDMERLAGPPHWLDLDECRYYISQRVAPDPETRKIWEHNEAEAAIADARAYLALVEVDNRRLKREAKEREDTAKFEEAKKDAVKRKRREAYAEAAGLMTTRAVKTLTKMKAKNVLPRRRISPFRRVVVVSLHPYESSPGMMEVGRFFFEFE